MSLAAVRWMMNANKRERMRERERENEREGERERYVHCSKK